MRANVAIFKRDMIGTRSLPPVFTAATLVEVLPLHHEHRQSRDAVGYPARLV
jgi:hypothetical protein